MGLAVDRGMTHTPTPKGKANGAILYEGPSLIDGAPIVVIATGLAGRGSANRKTGAMVQTWIIRADVSPIDAWKDGRDASVCGDCKHRRRQNGGNGTCYVNVGQAPGAVWRAYRRGAYPVADPIDVGAGRVVRIGSYGDPGAVPIGVWRRLTEGALSHTGYTHRWGDTGAGLAGLCMASADTPAEAAEAQTRGFRTFRVAPVGDTGRARGEARCPASAEAGAKVSCVGCPIKCNGGAGLNVVIQAHGAAAKRHGEDS